LLVRVVVERVNGEPNHSLTRSDVKTVVRTAESKFGRFPGLVVHLKSTLPENGAFDRPAIYSDASNRLNFLCRGVPMEVAVKELLWALVAIDTRESLGKRPPLSVEDLKGIDAKVGEILPMALAAVAEKRPDKTMEPTR
jgi:hypothetical protein